NRRSLPRSGLLVVITSLLPPGPLIDWPGLKHQLRLLPYRAPLTTRVSRANRRDCRNRFFLVSLRNFQGIAAGPAYSPPPD
ncbi:MAG TPA: hypothetical protein P5057_05500, partial [Acidobacteriota bacterium]|nr:hypothetical protein [Acidobacteriota bacterium]